MSHSPMTHSKPTHLLHGWVCSKKKLWKFWPNSNQRNLIVTGIWPSPTQAKYIPSSLFYRMPVVVICPIIFSWTLFLTSNDWWINIISSNHQKNIYIICCISDLGRSCNLVLDVGGTYYVFFIALPYVLILYLVVNVVCSLYNILVLFVQLPYIPWDMFIIFIQTTCTSWL